MIGFWPCGQARAQMWNGSLRLDYQSIDAPAVADGRGERLNQRYYIRYVDRLFTKNTLMFTGNFVYRTGGGQPVDFRPRYEWLLTSYGYGARVAYEPYTTRLGGTAASEKVRRWRSGVFVNPDRWPRLAYDWSRASTDRGSVGKSRDNWDSYSFNWQPGTSIMSAAFTRQTRFSRDSLGESSESYRALTSTDRVLPLGHRVNLSYAYNRTWRRRFNGPSNSLDQHSPSASLSGQPLGWFSWYGQYAGRYRTQRDADDRASRTLDDQLASGSITISPAQGLSLSATRYYDETEEEQGGLGRITNYWQVRASREGRFYRQLRSLFTVYRIIHLGAPAGLNYSDGYFASLRGRVHRHVELSTETSVGDRHGAQGARYAMNLNSFLRLFPSPGSNCQVGYSASAQSVDLRQFDISDENVTANIQYFPEPVISLSVGTVMRRNRLIDNRWTSGLTFSGSYRWPDFANISVNYNSSERIIPPGAVDQDAQGRKTLLLDAVWWLGPSSTINAGWSRRTGGAADAADQWSIGFATQF